MEVTTAWRGTILIASLKGELDTMEGEGLSAAMELIAKSETSGVVLDFSGMTYIASLGIGILLTFARDVRKRKIAARIAAPSPAILTVLETVQLGTVLPIDATVEESLVKMRRVVASASC